MSYTVVPYVEKMINGLDIVIFTFAPEPARTDRHICLTCHPCFSIHISFIERRLRRSQTSRTEAFYIKRRPACFTGNSAFVSYPAASWTYISKDHRIRMMSVYLSVKEIPVIYLLFSVRALTTSSVKPLFEDFAVVCMGMLDRPSEDLIIFRSSVMRVILIPWRYIDSELETVFPTCFRELLEYISFSVTPFALSYGMRTLRVRPDAETVMMLSGNYDTFHSCFLGNGSPLTAVESCRSKYINTLCSISPLDICESVRTEMDKHVELHLLPFYLCWSRQSSIWLRSLNTAGCKNSCSQNHIFPVLHNMDHG